MRPSSFVVALTLLAVAAPTAAAAAPPRAQTAAVGVAPPATVPDARNVGDAPAGQAVDLDVLLSPRDPDALDAFVEAVSTPGSPLYGDYLATGEFRDRFGPTQATIDKVSTTLRSAGLTPGEPSRSGLFIPVRTTVAAAEAALDTQIDSYRLASGERAIAATSAPRLARSIAPDVQAIVGLDTRARLRRNGQQRRIDAPAGSGANAVTSSGSGVGASALPAGWDGPTACRDWAEIAQLNGVYTMGQIADAYDFGNFYDAGNAGAGATIALAEFEPYLDTDIQAFQDCYGTDTSITNYTVGTGPGTGAGIGEAALDIQVLIGLAPEADILVYSAANAANNADLYAKIADDNSAPIISTSWGVCEPALDQSTVLAEAAVFAQMATQGQTIFAAAGDQGSSDCYSLDPTATQLASDDPGTQPNVTSVGGTSMAQPTFPPVERVWNNGVATPNGGAGAGGQSASWPMPAYQAGPGVIGQYTNGQACGFVYANCRQVPDVSALADPKTGYFIAYNGGFNLDGGTSAATPLWAALTALVSQSPQCVSNGRLGLLNPAFYQLAGSTVSPFNDITVGNNDYLGTNGGLFPATVAYDMASGLGSPIGGKLASGLCGGIRAPSITSADRAAFTAGQPSSFTVTTTAGPVARLSITGTLPVGVTFSDAGNGTATLAGTPAASAAGTYTVVLGAGNGIAPAASQSFTLTVAAPPTPVGPPTPPAQPAPVGLPQASASTRVRLGTLPKRVFTVARSGRVTILVSCPKVAGGCRTGITLSARVGGRGRGRARTIVLGRTRPQALTAGRTRGVVVNVSRAGRRAILAARAGRLRTTLTLNGRFANGQTARTTTSIVLRMAARR